MKLLASVFLGFLGLAESDPKCGIVCLKGMDCDRNQASAPLTDVSSGLKPAEKVVATGPGAKQLGSAAEPGMFPWMAGIFVKTTRNHKGKQFDQLCGGSIINSRTILTAATCFTIPNSKKLKTGVAKFTKVHVGFPTGLPEPDKTHRDISEEARSYGQGIFDIQKIEIHKRFTGRQPEQYDAAVIILKTPIVYHKSIAEEKKTDYDFFATNGTVVSKSYSWTRPVCLAKRQFEDNYLRKTAASGNSLANCLASGYGKDQTGQMGRLNFGFMEFIQDKTCKNKLNTIKASPIYQKLKGMKTKLPKSYLCAQGKKMDNVENMAIVLENNGDDGVAMSACEGDTGSPLACMPNTNTETPSQFIQVGITSFGLTCGAPKVPGVYTRTGGITQWVNRVAKKFGIVQWKAKPDTKF